MVAQREQSFPRMQNPGAFFNAPPSDAPHRPFLAADAADEAATKPRLYRPGTLQPPTSDLELVAPPTAASPDAEGSPEFDDDPGYDLLSPDGFDPHRLTPGATEEIAEAYQPAPGSEGIEAADESEPEPIADIAQHPEYRKALEELEAVRQAQAQQEAEAKRHQLDALVRQIQQDKAATAQRRAALFRQFPDLDPQQAQQHVAQELEAADARANYWENVALGAVNHVEWTNHLAATVERHGLSEDEAMSLANVPAPMLEQQARSIVALRQNRTAELEELRAKVAALESGQRQPRQPAPRGRARDPRVHAVGGGTGRGAAPRRQIAAGSNEHLHALLFGK